MFLCISDGQAWPSTIARNGLSWRRGGVAKFGVHTRCTVGTCRETLSSTKRCILNQQPLCQERTGAFSQPPTPHAAGASRGPRQQGKKYFARFVFMFSSRTSPHLPNPFTRQTPTPCPHMRRNLYPIHMSKLTLPARYLVITEHPSRA